jgi:hypothetical protein
MTTTTARYALNKIVLASDNVDVVNDFNVNWDAIDLKLGSQVCTSSTRPASPVQGMDIYETDTGATRTYSGSAWQPSPIMVATSSSRPANPITGDTVYETDTGMFAVNVGSSTWRYRNIFPCTSSTRPTSNVSTGAMIYETDTKRVLVNNAGTWEQKAFSNFVCTSSTHPAAPFQGLEIYETDTGFNAVYTGSYYSYGWQQLAPTQVLGSAAASITFSSIPAVPRLMVVWRVRCSDAVAAEPLWLRMNGDSAAHYLWEVSQANNATVAGTTSGALVSQIQAATVPAASATAGYFGSGQFIIDGANDSSNFPTAVGNGTAYASATSMWTGTYGGLYNQVGPVTSVTLLPGNTANFVAKSAFTLYGAM